MLSKKIQFSCAVLVLILLFFNRHSNIDYACTDYWSYLRVTSNPNCYYNPDIRNDTLGIIRRHTNLGEKHQVQTEDGYILTLFRIPKKSPKGTILLQHGGFYDSTVWVAQHNESIAFFFWRHGYDVWLGNFRGNIYSNKHKTISKNDPKFWNFTLTELGYLDNKATIDYIVKQNNGNKIIYLGYSMAGTSGLVYASIRSEEAKKNLKILVSMGGPAFPKNSPSWFYKIGRIPWIYNSIGKYMKVYKIGGYDNWFVRLVHAFHGVVGVKKWAAYIFAPILGCCMEEVDPKFANDIIHHLGSEFSWKLLEQFGQLGQPGTDFQMYDYGKVENVVTYGSETPPKYPLSKIKVPVLSIYSKDDNLANIEDQRLLEMKLPDRAKIYGSIDLKGYSHMGLIFGKRRNEEIYEKILQKLDKI